MQLRADCCPVGVQWRFLDAGVVKLADARDSKSRGVHSPCGFDSHLRHQQSPKIRAYLTTDRSVHFGDLPYWQETGRNAATSGREFRFTKWMREVVLERQRKFMCQIERAKTDRDSVGIRRTDEIRDYYYTAWRTACEAAGIEWIPHDFHRTSARNFERAGVPRTTAMAMVGHKTESVYQLAALQHRRSGDARRRRQQAGSAVAGATS
jgi:hypothetical protein